MDEAHLVRERDLAHRYIERGGIVLGAGVVAMIASFAVAIHYDVERMLFGALVGWLAAVLGAIWLVDGLRHHYAAQRESREAHA